MKSKEIKSLTGVRGIAALIIVIHHFSSKYFVPVLEKNRNNNFISEFIFNYSNNGYLMVELFFVLSGFVLSISYDKQFHDRFNVMNYRSYMVKRFSRIYPLYFISILMYFFLFYYSEIRDFFTLVLNLGFLELWAPKQFSLNNVSWSLCAEWFIYLLFPYLLYKTLSKNYSIIKLAIIALIVYILAPVLNTERLYNTVFYTIGDLRMSNGTGALLRCLGSYFLGLAVYKVYKFHPSVVKSLNKYWYLVIVALAVAYGFDKTDIIITFLFALLIISITNSNTLSVFLSHKWIYFLGLISYSVYLMHMIFLRLIIYSFKAGFWKENLITLSISFVLLLCSTIIFSYFTYKIIELPGTSYFNKKFLKK